MKTTTEIKRFFKTTFGITVRANTSPGKGKWQSVYIKPDPSNNIMAPLTYPATFPGDFTNLCIRTVYPTSPGLHLQIAAGNIMAHSIAMSQTEWETVINATLDKV